MGTIATDQRKSTLYYNSETSLGQQTYPYVYGLDKNIHTIDISKTKVTGTQWVTLAEGLKTPLSNLINTEHPDFTLKYKDTTALSDTDWIKVLNANPQCLRAPILIYQTKYYLINTPSEVQHIISNTNKTFDARNPD